MFSIFTYTYSDNPFEIMLDPKKARAPKFQVCLVQGLKVDHLYIQI